MIEIRWNIVVGPARGGSVGANEVRRRDGPRTARCMRDSGRPPIRITVYGNEFCIRDLAGSTWIIDSVCLYASPRCRQAMESGGGVLGNI